MIVWGIFAWLGWGTKEFFFLPDRSILYLDFVLLTYCIWGHFNVRTTILHKLILKNEGRIIAFHLRLKRRDLFASDTHHKNCWKQQFFGAKSNGSRWKLISEGESEKYQTILFKNVCLAPSIYHLSIELSVFLSTYPSYSVPLTQEQLLVLCISTGTLTSL